MVWGGNINASVVRVGDTVRRSIGHWTPAVHALLTHLDAQNFDASPRVLGIDEQGREILTYAPGEPLHEIGITDDDVARAGALIRSYHAAVASFTPPPDADWWTGSADPHGGTLVLHGDLAPWNVIVDGDTWTLIDWDFAGPGRAEWELAYAIHGFVGMWPASEHDDATTVRRVRAFAEGYDLMDRDLQRVLMLVPKRLHDSARMISVYAEQGHAGFIALRDAGHIASWAAAADHVAARLTTWTRML